MFKTRKFRQNRRQGLRSGSRSRAWTKTFFWCILKRDKDRKIPGPQFSYENESFLSLKLWRAMQCIIFTCRFQVWNCVEVWNFAIFEMNFFRKFSSNFWFFVAIVGKISSSSCQSRRKNSKTRWYGLFWAGRSWRFSGSEKENFFEKDLLGFLWNSK